MQQAAAPDDSVEMAVYAGVGKTLQDEILAVFILVTYMLECGKLAYVMVRAGHPYGLVILVDGNLRGRRTWVDY
jgi:hypothetical protein